MVDLLAHKFPNESPYVYAGNNPLCIVDPNGKFKLNVKLVMKYPLLMSAILQAENLASKSSKVQNYFKNKVGVSVNEFIGFGLINDKGDVIRGVGNGPEILIDYPNFKLPLTMAGFTKKTLDHTDDIAIAGWLAEKLNSSNPDEVNAAIELIIRTIIHETAHRLNKKGKKTDKHIDTVFDIEVFNESKQVKDYDSYWEWWYDEEWQKIKSETNSLPYQKGRFWTPDQDSNQ